MPNPNLKTLTIDTTARDIVEPVIDTAISSTSENAVQNKVVKEYVDWTKVAVGLVSNGVVAQNTNVTFTLSETSNNFQYIGINLYSQADANRFFLHAGQFRNTINGGWGKKLYFTVYYSVSTTPYLLQITSNSATQIVVRHNIPQSMNFSVAGYYRIDNYPTTSGTNSTNGLLMAQRISDTAIPETDIIDYTE